MKQPRISYAPSREDLVVKGYFPDVTDGCYVDIGAASPLEGSVTKLFYSEGWHGVHIAATPGAASMLTLDRPRDTVVTGGRLAQLFAEANVRQIHFLRVAPGQPLAVLETNDWSKYRPEVVCLPAATLAMPLLSKHRYTEALRDGHNAYYVAEESARRAREWQALEGIPVAMHEQIACLKRDQAVLQLRLQEVTRAKIYAEYQVNWYERAPLKWMLVKTVRAFDRAVMTRVEREPVMRAAYDGHAAVQVKTASSATQLRKLNASYAQSAWSELPPVSPVTTFFIKPVGGVYVLLRRAARLAVRTVKRA
ncbi:MAG TPA: hypothetical protein VD735_03340 [Candidatus Saccharimonadales bacterium]|nr:hypothetical protein [Candidatus Saccharimonadales bacterium]